VRRSSFRSSLILASVAVLVSAIVRWHLADLAFRGVDESANLWLGSLIRSGERVPLGLMSSRGLHNFVGSPIVAAPFTVLPDLLAISQALSLLQLAVLTALALVLWKRGSRLDVSVTPLVCFPTLVLVSSGLWNQYLAALLTVAAIPVLLVVADGGKGGAVQALALIGVAAISAAMPTVHLGGFADALALLGLTWALLILRPRPVNGLILGIGLLVISPVVVAVYRPWFRSVQGTIGGGVFWQSISLIMIATVSGAAALARWIPTFTANVAESYYGSRICAFAACLCLLISTLYSFIGALVHRLAVLDMPVIWALFGSQVAMCLAFLPAISRLIGDARSRLPANEVLRKHFHHQTDGAVLLTYAVLVCAIRLVLAPTLLLPWGRTDLLVPVVPALLAPLTMLRQRRGRLVSVLGFKLASASAVFAMAWLGFTGVSGLDEGPSPSFVPASEMRAAVDWIAARHQEQGSGGTIDVGYDLARGLEWVGGPRWCGTS
jgi:hypothetical protein